MYRSSLLPPALLFLPIGSWAPPLVHPAMAGGAAVPAYRHAESLQGVTTTATSLAPSQWSCTPRAAGPDALASRGAPSPARCPSCRPPQAPASTPAPTEHGPSSRRMRAAVWHGCSAFQGRRRCGCSTCACQHAVQVTRSWHSYSGAAGYCQSVLGEHISVYTEMAQAHMQGARLRDKVPARAVVAGKLL